MTETLRTLMTALIDYAGLFPPAKLDMETTVRNYATYLAGDNAFALGRIKCRVSQLEELTKHGAIVMPGTYATSGYTEMAGIGGPWSISGVIDGDLDACLDAIDAFNQHHEKHEHGLANINAIEVKISDPSDVDAALDIIPEDLAVALELPTSAIFGGDPRGFVAALAGGEAKAKIRCGGVKPDMIPSTDDIARFINACATAEVAFEPTAGLHHPVRAEQPLTYDDNPPRATMHGFLNVFLGAALVRWRIIAPDQLVTVLNETDPKAFAFDDEKCSWRGNIIELDRLARAREQFCLGYGSCSFTEPFDDLETLGLI
ncbi:MAG: hypothetical protein DHS20C14_11060 [Phycisphaeraceae bacterium]|nr:MAG: hypothetical protein DHS20C14_11060 [Phycisphaeraceae bacterium]